MPTHEERDEKIKELESRLRNVEQGWTAGEERLSTATGELSLARNSDKQHDTEIATLKAEVKTLKDEVKDLREKREKEIEAARLQIRNIITASIVGICVTVPCSVVAGVMLAMFGFKK